MKRTSRSVAVFTRVLAAGLILSVAVSGTPAAAQEVGDQVTAAPSELRESIDKAVETAGTAPQDALDGAVLTAEERVDVVKRAGRLRADPVAGQASGGGKLRAIVSVLGIAASAWATWYTIQYMKKQQEREQTGFRP